MVNSVGSAFAADDTEVLKIRKGTFAKVMTLDEFSTLTADTEDEVKFINTQDMYVYETNAIPEGTIFYGEIEDVKEPVKGKDGAFPLQCEGIFFLFRSGRIHCNV